MGEEGKGAPENPLRSWPAVLLAMLSLSIGWGIRGNFGHEYGAMVPGALCAVAVCLFSERADWRRRVLYFAVFGALGWGFGGSISYMPTISYTHSGHLPTQLYGFFTVFLVGFLWAGMGGAGTAYAAVEEKQRLNQIFKPLCFVLALWAIQYFWEDDFLRLYAQWQRTGAGRDFRQRSPLYWLDSEWVEATLALVALCLFDLWDRRFEKLKWLPVYGGLGAVAGFLVQKLLVVSGLIVPLLSALVHPQGDLSAINPATGLPFDPENMVTNWPELFSALSAHLGWIFGLAAGVAAYFARWGKWRSGSSLLLHIALGSLAFFLVGPVLLSNLFREVGGFRLTPPRGDSWANIVGAFAGMMIYMYRNRLLPVATAAWISGILGGLGFMLAQSLKVLALMPGNPVLTQNPEIIGAWRHWRSANWHSILAEQGVGMFYGLAIWAAMATLLPRIRRSEEHSPPSRRTQVFAVSFILNLLVYVNLVKNIADWTRERTGGFRSVPLMMKAPLFGSIEMSALGWFNVTFLLVTLVTIALLVVHLRKPLAVMPPSWLGKGQLFYLALLWAMVIGNFEKALVAFREQRLGTEWVIFVNALVGTLLILAWARINDLHPEVGAANYRPIISRTLRWGAAAVLLGIFSFTAVVHGVYGDKHDGWGGGNLRFGPKADWRTRPILKSVEHR